MSAVRAWKTSALTFAGGQPSTRAMSAWPRSPELGEHERLALVVGQPRQVAQQLAQLGAALDVRGQPVERRLEILGRERGLAPGREHGEAAVARDRVEPRAHPVGRAPAGQRAVGADERLLQRVLAVLAVAEHVAAEGEQRRRVPVVQRLEGVRVPRADQPGQPLVVHPAVGGPHRAALLGDGSIAPSLG